VFVFLEDDSPGRGFLIAGKDNLQGRFWQPPARRTRPAGKGMNPKPTG
jgi:hypothetical protein